MLSPYCNAALLIKNLPTFSIGTELDELNINVIIPVKVQKQAFMIPYNVYSNSQILLILIELILLHILSYISNLE